MSDNMQLFNAGTSIVVYVLELTLLFMRYDGFAILGGDIRCMIPMGI